MTSKQRRIPAKTLFMVPIFTIYAHLYSNYKNMTRIIYFGLYNLYLPKSFLFFSRVKFNKRRTSELTKFAQLH